MKKRILGMLLAATMLIGMFSGLTFTASAAETVKEVSTWSEFASAMSASGTATIKLTREIKCSHGVGSDGHAALVVKGNKTVDLNGYGFGCDDYSNAKKNGYNGKGHWFTTCYSTKGNTKTLVEIPSGASLTIDDTSTNPGTVFFRGYTVGSTTLDYPCIHYDGVTKRDIFKVNGALTINSGIIEPGNAKKYFVTNGVDFDEWASPLLVHLYGNAHEQISGTAIVANGSANVTINGGNIIGRGIEADLRSGLDKPGSIFSADGIIDAGKEFIDPDTTDYVVVRSRDEAVEVQGGKVTINGGKLIGKGGANIFGGSPAGKVAINAGTFNVETEERIRAKDYMYNQDEYFAAAFDGRKGTIGITSAYFKDISNAFVNYKGTTAKTAAEIRALDLEKAESTVTIGQLADPLKQVTITKILPERRDPNDTDKTEYQQASLGDTLTFSIDAIELTADQKAKGYTMKKTIRIRGEDPLNAKVDVLKESKAAGALTVPHKFDIRSWYKIAYNVSIYDKDNKKVSGDAFTYYYFIEAKETDIVVTKMPTKTVYNVGEKIDTTGMVITANFADKTTSDVTPYIEVEQKDGAKEGQEYFVVNHYESSVKVPITVKGTEYTIAVKDGSAEIEGKGKVTVATSGNKIKLVHDAAATPAGKEFAGWEAEGEAGTEIAKDGESYSFTMPKNNVSIKAVYKDKPSGETTPGATEPEATTPEATEPETNKTEGSEEVVNTFKDVTEGQWYYNDVVQAVKLKLVNGKSPTEYKPNDNMTFAEAIKLAACMNILYNGGDPAKDIANGTDVWYSTYMNYALDMNIIDKDYSSKANQKITRSEYVYIFSKALPAEALPEKNDIPSGSIPDVKSELSPQHKAVYKFYRAGILSGNDKKGTFNPSGNIKRSEVAAILIRMMDSTRRVDAPKDLVK